MSRPGRSFDVVTSAPRTAWSVAADHEVEPVAERPLRLCQAEVERRHHALPRARVGNRLQHRIVRKQRIVGEEHLRDQPRQERRAEDREMDVRRTPGVRMVSPRIGAGLDRRETVASLGVGLGRPAPVKFGSSGAGWCPRCADTALRHLSATSRQHVRQRPAVLVDDAARDDDAFALRLAARALTREVVVGRADRQMAVHRLRQIGVDAPASGSGAATARAASSTGTADRAAGAGSSERPRRWWARALTSRDQTRSSSSAMPWPTPMHIVQRAYRPVPPLS